MAEPFEIITAPFDVWIAPVGEAFPGLGTDPASPWELIGTNGNRNHSDDGVTITHNETVEDFRTRGATGPVKSFRTEESIVVAFNLHDLTLEQYARVMNFNAITDNSAETPPDKTIDLYRGVNVGVRALLVRGPSPYMDGGQMQFEVPKVRADGNSEVQFSKSTPAGLSLAFTTLEDLNAASESERFGRLRAQTAA